MSRIGPELFTVRRSGLGLGVAVVLLFLGSYGCGGGGGCGCSGDPVNVAGDWVLSGTDAWSCPDGDSGNDPWSDAAFFDQDGASITLIDAFCEGHADGRVGDNCLSATGTAAGCNNANFSVCASEVTGNQVSGTITYRDDEGCTGTISFAGVPG